MAAVRVRKPPATNDRAIDELVLVCQPTDAGCSPTRIRVERCSSPEEEGCRVRDGIHDLLSELEAYRDYVDALNGEEPLAPPEDP